MGLATFWDTLTVAVDSLPCLELCVHEFANGFVVFVYVSQNVKSVDEFWMNLWDPKSNHICCDMSGSVLMVIATCDWMAVLES